MPTFATCPLNTSSTLTFSKLGCTRGGRQLFKGVDCTLHAGHWLYVTGANGVGKTSLLRMLCGLAQVESGEILWNGTPIGSQRDSYQQDLCYLGHLNALQESMSVQENLMFTSALLDAGQMNCPVIFPPSTPLF